MDQCFHHLNQWFKTNQGERLSHYIGVTLALVLKDLSGKTLLQLGIEEHNAWLSSSPINKKVICLPFQGKQKPSVIASMYQLPFDSGSMDVIFCPFFFNALLHKHSLFSEIDRVLTPHGHVIICGLNPFSWWGLPSVSHQPLQGLGPVRAHVLRKSLYNLGYSVDDVHRFVYWPPFIKHIFFERLFEKMGQMILPSPAGFYLLSAQKNTFQPLRNVTPMFYERGISSW